MTIRAIVELVQKILESHAPSTEKRLKAIEDLLIDVKAEQAAQTVILKAIESELKGDQAASLVLKLGTPIPQ